MADEADRIARPDPTPIGDDAAIRPARREDVDLLVAFTLAEALEAEGRTLDDVAARRGVEGAFADPPLATYWVAEAAAGAIVASISTVAQRSNVHAGHYWWVQSLFVTPAHRGRGLAERLLDHVADAAASAGALDLRLYAHRHNARALRAYRRYGFVESAYVIMSRGL